MSTAIQQFRHDQPRLNAEDLAKKQAEHEKFISYTPAKQAVLKLREVLSRYQGKNVQQGGYDFNHVDSKAVDVYAKYLVEEIKLMLIAKDKPQKYAASMLTAYRPWRPWGCLRNIIDTLERGGLVEKLRDGVYQYTEAGRLLASALYADPPDFSKVNAKAAEREKKKEEAKKAKIMSQRAARTYLNVPYPERWIAKQHGARWDKDVKKWYLPDGVEMHEDLKQYAFKK
jgi:hypothetical protein